MCNKYDAKLSFTDTDSLVYEINTEDVYKQCFKDRELFDFSGYPIDSKYYVKQIKKNRIQSKLHEIGTYYVFKISLSFFDDKRYVLDDGINTPVYFHKDIKKLRV